MVKCINCGSENISNARFCSSCGQALPRAVVPGEEQVGTQLSHETMQRALQRERLLESLQEMNAKKTEMSMVRVFGGMGWVMASLATFLVAFGFLGLIDSAYSAYAVSDQTSWHLVGYGIVVYGIGAMFISITRFVRSH